MNASKLYRCVATAVFCWLQFALVASGQDADVRDVRDSMRQPAVEVYQQLLSQYRAGESHGPERLEALRNWSARVLQVEIWNTNQEGLSKAELVAEAMKAHQARMTSVEKLVLKLHKVGKATRAEVAAAGFFRFEAGRLPEALQAMHRFEAEERELDLALPEVIDAQPLTAKPKEIIVNIDKDGNIFVTAKQHTSKELAELLQAAAAENPRQAVLIRADQQSLFRHVAEVMSVCRQAGLDLSVSVREE